MNIDAGFFYNILTNADPKLLTRIERDWICAEWLPVYDFCVECLGSSMRKLPSVDTIEQAYHKVFLSSMEDGEYYINALRERKALHLLEAGIRDILPMVTSETPKPIEAASALMALGAKIARGYRPRNISDCVDFCKDIEIREKEYASREENQGLLGVPFPFGPMNLTTGGMIGGEVSAFFGESGVGKTWLLLLCAAHAIEQNYSIAIFSQEMQPKRLSIRLDSLMAKISAENFRKGCLEKDEKDALASHYKSLTERQNKCLIFGPADVSSLSGFESMMAVIASQVDVVFWDSPYLCIRSESWEEKGVFVRDLKNFAEDFNLPVILTWQLNRKGEVALTSAITQDLDHNFVIGRDAHQKDLKQAKIWSIKTRDGLELEEMILIWDVPNVRFMPLSWKIPGMASQINYAVEY